MPLEVYHLHLSQSERILWLLEEMQVPYNLHVFQRDPQTALAPVELKKINPAGTAPYLRDTSADPEVSLSESTAILTYILVVYGPTAPSTGTRMHRTPSDPDYGPYLEYIHFANGSIQATIGRLMTLWLAGLPASAPAMSRTSGRLSAQLRQLDERLAENRYLAGEQVSAADAMVMFSTSTMRGFCPVDLGPFPHVLRWMGEVAARPAYRKALERGDGGMEPMIQENARRFVEFPAFKELPGKM